MPDRWTIAPVLVLTCAALAACGGSSRAPAESVPAPQMRPALLPAADALAALEARLRSAPEIRLNYRISSEGAFPSDLEGRLTLTGARGVQLHATGSFGEQPVELRLRSARGEMTGGSRTASFTENAPIQTRESIVIGLARMGLLHNLARLVSGQPPDHYEGGVRDWVRAVRIRGDEPEHVEGVIARPISFAIDVDGRRAGEATLWLNVDTGWPVLRTQTVYFPGGEMEVEERYEFF